MINDKATVALKYFLKDAKIGWVKIEKLYHFVRDHGYILKTSEENGIEAVTLYTI